MIKYDATHPNGIELPPIQPSGIELAPVTVRQMTEEERQRYAALRPNVKYETAKSPKDWGEV